MRPPWLALRQPEHMHTTRDGAHDSGPSAHPFSAGEAVCTPDEGSIANKRQKKERETAVHVKERNIWHRHFSLWVALKIVYAVFDVVHTLFFCCLRVTSVFILEAMPPMVLRLSSTLECIVLSIAVCCRIVSSSDRYRGMRCKPKPRRRRQDKPSRQETSSKAALSYIYVAPVG